ncbi:SGNH/GDSL hydrolase family protein [Stieleria sp. JC731]|uniref:SGNH/GDSL hydrolase family protein n=1 Tax=Pirellulaceae TaxID=2691357 RepID=UPI001E3A1B59|nr:SGNH/GDSL hydrolase family protein [Stieleria sp. JC731]MCC9600711.1 SGNH/GDSL hydrolase family protein [Stieleria sp. JC731]
MKYIALLAITVASFSISWAEEFPPPTDFGTPEQLGRGVQRTMTLLASSTPSERHTVRILLYGQSITAGQWGVQLEQHLRKTYPNANLIYDRRPLSGYSTERLVKTSEADLYPAYADLVIFHDYGNNEDYETMIRKLREQTTSEILIQGDHFRRSEQLVDETDLSAIESRSQIWAAQRNLSFLPSIADKYGCGYEDRRGPWLRYLRKNQLEPGQLVKDDVHPNEHGTYLMTELVKAYLVPREDVKLDPMNCGYVTTIPVEDIDNVSEGRIEFPFDGNRIDVVFKDGAKAECKVLIDGHPPLDDPSMFYHGRNRVKWRDTPIPPGPWPPALKVGFNKPLVDESWTLLAQQDPQKPTAYTFEVVGSVTGPDGSGRTDEPFISNSGRVVIEAEDWDVQFAIVALRRLDSLPSEFQIDWNVIKQATDVAKTPDVAVGVEPTVTVAQRIVDGHHRVELQGDVNAVKALRVYSPSKFPRGK